VEHILFLDGKRCTVLYCYW